MWLLESDADFLRGKRMWLKPGQKYLFGRVKRDDVRYALDHKTISRKHFIVHVDPVKSGDVSRLHAKSKISISDEKSKHGTYIDGRLLKDQTKDLINAQHSIRPGSFPHEIVIKWVPCVLSFQLTKKEIKADALKAKRERLEGLDIKVSTEYVNEVTTHVVANKRNTVKGLQALIQGKYLVSDSFIDALIYAATPADLGEDENLSPLEQEFDRAWPKAKDHLPRAGKEPTVRPDSAYNPEASRSNIFENFVFVFLDKSQHDLLLPAVTCGQGKALLFSLINGETTVEDLTQIMQNAAGKKGFGDVESGSASGGAVMVRSSPKEEHVEWITNVINEVALKLDQRAIEQAEFLDAILANDALLLRQSVPYASTVEGRAAPPPTAASIAIIQQTPSSPQRADASARSQLKDKTVSAVQVPSSNAELSQSPPSAAMMRETQKIPSSAPEQNGANTQPPAESQPPPKRQKFRSVPVSRFKDFDDDFDENSIPSYSADAFPDSIVEASQVYDKANDSADDSSNQSVDASVKEEPGTSKKRHRSPSPTSEGNDAIDELLPAATAMKRRKLAMDAEARRNDQPFESSKKGYLPPPVAKKKKKEIEIDVREIARAQRQKEEEAARKEREDLAEGLGYDNDEMGGPAGLAVVEEMQLPVRSAVNVRRGHGEANSRWDPKWNGRKNFKKFRRSGTTEGIEARRRPERVIVPLVEVKSNTYGIGEQYWDGGSKSKKRGGVSQFQSQSQSQPQRETQMTSQTVSGTDEAMMVDSDDDDHISPHVSRLNREAVSVVNHTIDPDTPRRTRLADKTQSANARTSQKRPASKSAASNAREKRQKTIPVREERDSESEDSDDLKFKFGRRKKQGA